MCVNACRMSTQEFFNTGMGVPMRMMPDYETLACRFEFGVPPTAEDEAEARSVPCFGACPMAAEGLRQQLEAPERCGNMGEAKPM